MNEAMIPLFPLNTVLFIDGRLPLRIFEPRYVEMVSRCMRAQSGFGVVLIREGSEARLDSEAVQPQIFDLGTYAEITDFDALPNGLLGIVGTGRRKFRVRSLSEQSDHLLMGEVEYLPEEPALRLPDEYRPLSELLVKLLDHPAVRHLQVQVDLNDARSVSWRLAELLPVEAEIKQSLLMLGNPRERLAELNRLVERLQ